MERDDAGTGPAVTEWREEYARTPLRDADFETLSGIPLEPVYGLEGELPGRLPVHPGPVRLDVPVEAVDDEALSQGFGTAEDTNVRFKEILRSGGDGLSTAFDLPTLDGQRLGRPALGSRRSRTLWSRRRHPRRCRGSSFPGIDLDAVTTSMTINSPASIPARHVRGGGRARPARRGAASAGRSRTTS